jgi:hypothetical protein
VVRHRRPGDFGGGQEGDDGDRLLAVRAVPGRGRLQGVADRCGLPRVRARRCWRRELDPGRRRGWWRLAEAAGAFFVEGWKTEEELRRQVPRADVEVRRTVVGCERVAVLVDGVEREAAAGQAAARAGQCDWARWLSPRASCDLRVRLGLGALSVTSWAG